MTLKANIFEHPFRYVLIRHILTCPGQMWCKSAVGKLPESRFVLLT